MMCWWNSRARCSLIQSNCANWSRCIRTGTASKSPSSRSETPAAKVELKKNDVLVEFEGQMLVDPIQLRKLVQMHPDGDSVKITFFQIGNPRRKGGVEKE